MAIILAGLGGKGEVRPVSSAWALEADVVPEVDISRVGYVVKDQMEKVKSRVMGGCW